MVDVQQVDLCGRWHMSGHIWNFSLQDPEAFGQFPHLAQGERSTVVIFPACRSGAVTYVASEKSLADLFGGHCAIMEGALGVEICMLTASCCGER
jgi:hypothetical protein